MNKVWKEYFSSWKIWVYFGIIALQVYIMTRFGIFKEYYWLGGIILIIAPFYEWLVHKYILHTRVGKIHYLPRERKHKKYFYGELIELELEGKKVPAKVIAVEDDYIMLGTGWVRYFPIIYHLMQDLHYGHHKNPNDLSYVIAPVWGGLAVIAHLFITAYLVSGFNWKAALVVSFYTAIYYVFYEWVHLSHHIPDYEPPTAWGKLMRKIHTNHHFHHEDMWWGITNPLADYALGTNKEPEGVARSVHTHEINYE